jgi:hypothetical protein
VVVFVGISHRIFSKKTKGVTTVANEMRDRLVELLNKTFDAQYTKSVLITAEHTADHLIENGVVVLKHGEWIVAKDTTSVTYRCPVCSFELTLADPKEKLEYKGCPMCLSMLKEGV